VPSLFRVEGEKEGKVNIEQKIEGKEGGRTKKKKKKRKKGKEEIISTRLTSLVDG